MKRRSFIRLLGGAAAWPLAVNAQQPAERVRRIGILMNLPENESQGRIAVIRQGLLALGWTEGGNVRIDYRFLGGDATRVRAQAAELVSSAPELIVAHTSPVVAALKDLTHTIPIVFVAVNDPVGQGFISSLARPGGNITGFTFIDPELVGKWLEMLTEMAPSVRRAALMFNPKTNAYYHAYLRELGAAPNRLTSELVAAPVRDQAEIEAAIAGIARDPGGGLIGAADVFNVTHRRLIISLAERYRLPALYFNQYFVTEGGLMSYGPDTTDIFRQTAEYVDRILNGAKPGDLPAQAPTKFQLAINLKTAKSLGLEVPATLLARADEVIE